MAEFPSVADLIQRYGLKQDKKLGQHFLHHPQLLEKIAQAATPMAGHTVIEIGPGPGGLTRALLEAGAERLIAVERDPRCLLALQELVSASQNRLSLIEQDALKTDIQSLAPGPYIIVSNLPYNISTALLTRWLLRRESITRMALMFQKEVALRLLAAPNTNDYGRLSVLTQTVCQVDKCFDIRPEAFLPPPKVVSTVVRLTPRTNLELKAPLSLLETLTAAAFGQRRKMLRSSLKTLGIDTNLLLETAQIDGSLRAEQLAISDFWRLTESLARQINLS